MSEKKRECAVCGGQVGEIPSRTGGTKLVHTATGKPFGSNGHMARVAAAPEAVG